jgi:hypothetical protein
VALGDGETHSSISAVHRLENGVSPIFQQTGAGSFFQQSLASLPMGRPPVDSTITREELATSLEPRGVLLSCVHVLLTLCWVLQERF